MNTGDVPTRLKEMVAVRVDDAFRADLRSHFSEDEIIELAAVAGAFNYFNRFNNALQVEVTR